MYIYVFRYPIFRCFVSHTMHQCASITKTKSCFYNGFAYRLAIKFLMRSDKINRLNWEFRKKISLYRGNNRKKHNFFIAPPSHLHVRIVICRKSKLGENNDMSLKKVNRGLEIEKIDIRFFAVLLRDSINCIYNAYMKKGGYIC